MSIDPEMLGPLPNGVQNSVPSSRTVTSQEETLSKAIKYKIQYRNDAGEAINEVEQYKPWRNLTNADETGSVLDIVTYVTIRKLTFSTPVNSEASAKAASSSPEEPKNNRPKREKSTQDSVSSTAENEEPKNRNLEIKAVGETEMEIRSSALINALRALVDYYPSQQLTGSTITVPEPYHFLLHHQEKLEQLAHRKGDKSENGIIHESPDPKTIDHIEVLLAFLKSKFSKKVEEEEERHRKSPPTATFEMLWMLLKPGTRVYHEVDGDLAAFVVVAVNPSKLNSPKYYKVELWSLDFNGRRVGRCKREVIVTTFNGEREITSLKIFPVDMASDKSRLLKLEKSGEHYWNILRNGNEQVDYDGHSIGDTKRHLKGRVVLDPTSYYSYNAREPTPPTIGLDDDGSAPDILAGCRCSNCEDIRRVGRPSKWVSYDDLDPKNKEVNLTPEHFMLFPRKVPGFVLKSRTWDLLDINCVSELEPNQTAITNLVMNDKHLNMIRILTDKYIRQEKGRTASWSADFIRSKGEGQIFLLHGPPGVGKTYTAECISELTRRPLLALTTADIGTEEDDIEWRLSTWFDLAEIWGAVMLIDEADIYLEIRNTGDLKRNSLVSAFLRSMEYYRGIMFLTTNRVGQIDDAIMSRVHLVVRYERLTPMARIKIWNQFVEKLMDDSEDFSVDSRATEYVQDYFENIDVDWNGREIRNAIQTAVALAEHEAKSANPPVNKVKLKTTHIKDVVEMSQVFKKYLKDFKGDEAERALRDRTRMDKDKHQEVDIKSKLAAARETEGRKF